MTSEDRATRRRKELRARLIDAMSDAGTPDKMLSLAEIEALGVHRTHAASVQRASRQVTTVEEAVDAADDLAETIGDWMDQQDALTPADIIKHVPRF